MKATAIAPTGVGPAYEPIRVTAPRMVFANSYAKWPKRRTKAQRKQEQERRRLEALARIPKPPIERERPTYETYSERNDTLYTLGWASYADYLQSRTWWIVRQRVLKRDQRRCRCCPNEATEVHHRDYSRVTLLGETIEGLVSLCRICHEDAEFTHGVKNTLYRANGIIDRHLRTTRTRKKRRKG